MRLMFALLGILLITSGAIVLGTPYLAQTFAPDAVYQDGEGAGTRSFEKRAPGRPLGRDAGGRDTWFDQVRVVAEKANAPLSIIFGFMSLYYTRRTYHAQRSQ